jgi:hypothetical protein
MWQNVLIFYICSRYCWSYNPIPISHPPSPFPISEGLRRAKFSLKPTVVMKYIYGLLDGSGRQLEQVGSGNTSGKAFTSLTKNIKICLASFFLLDSHAEVMHGTRELPCNYEEKVKCRSVAACLWISCYLRKEILFVKVIVCWIFC